MQCQQVDNGVFSGNGTVGEVRGCGNEAIALK